MPNKALLLKELKGLIKLLAIFAAILTLYISMIIAMYDPSIIGTINQFRETMPELMAIVGMNGTSDSLTGFMISYLYGFILLMFPMIFSFFCAYKLVGKYIDKGSLSVLLSAPVSRLSIILTETAAAVIGLLILLLYITATELVCSVIQFPDETEIAGLLQINFGLFALHLFILGIGFLCAVSFNDLKGSIGAGAGIPVLSYVITMLGNAGEKTAAFRYLSFFSLYDPSGLVREEPAAYIGTAVLLTGAWLLFGLSAVIFSKRDFTL